MCMFGVFRAADGSPTPSFVNPWSWFDLAGRTICLVRGHRPVVSASEVDRIEIGLSGTRCHVIESTRACARCSKVLGRVVGAAREPVVL